jgi:lipoprotein-releasing system permease protein
VIASRAIMPYELFLALRYLRARRGAGRTGARVTALAALCGVACGVAALIVASALANGFRDEMRDKILSGTAHATIARTDGEAITDWRALAARVRSVEGVRDIAPTSYAGALLEGADNSAYAVVRAVDQTATRDLSEIRRTLISGSVEGLFQTSPRQTQGARSDESSKPHGADKDEPPAPVIVGAELAKRTGLVAVGDEGLLVTGEKTKEPPGFATRSRRVRVVGICRTGLFEYDSTWVYAPLADAAEIAGTPKDSAAMLSLETFDLYRAPEVAARVRAALGTEFTVVDWQEANRPLFAALALERRTVSIIVGLIILVAALNITTTLVLVVAERRADIAILGSIGARPASIMLVFMIEGAIIGALGSLSGVALGVAACFIGDRYRLVSLPAEVYSVSFVPFHAHAAETALAALVAFIVCLAATIYPARRAARLRPAEALRYE